MVGGFSDTIVGATKIGKPETASSGRRRRSGRSSWFSAAPPGGHFEVTAVRWTNAVSAGRPGRSAAPGKDETIKPYNRKSRSPHVNPTSGAPTFNDRIQKMRALAQRQRLQPVGSTHSRGLLESPPTFNG
jgi:hypothetical protein